MRHMKKETTRNRNRCGTSPETGLTVSVSVPKNLHIPLVSASILSDYEAWFFIASVLASAVVGFLVAGLANKFSMLATTLVFSILFAIAIKMTFSKRRRLQGTTKTFTLRNR